MNIAHLANFEVQKNKNRREDVIFKNIHEIKLEFELALKTLYTL